MPKISANRQLSDWMDTGKSLDSKQEITPKGAPTSSTAARMAGKPDSAWADKPYLFLNATGMQQMTSNFGFIAVYGITQTQQRRSHDFAKSGGGYLSLKDIEYVLGENGVDWSDVTVHIIGGPLPKFDVAIYVGM